MSAINDCYKLHRAIVLIVACMLLPISGHAAVAFDAWSNAASAFTNDAGGQWTHTPVGTPAAVGCWVVVRAATTDTIIGMTYGGTAMTEVSGSPVIHDFPNDDGVVHAFTLLASIPTGPQTVAVDVNSTDFAMAGCLTLTASTTVEIVDVDATINADVENPSVTLSLSGRTSFAAIGFHSGQDQPTGIAPLTDWTNRLEHDFGTGNAGFYTYNTIGTADVTAGWTQTTEDAAAIAIAFSEVAAGGSSGGLLLLGVGK